MTRARLAGAALTCAAVLVAAGCTSPAVDASPGATSGASAGATADAEAVAHAFLRAQADGDYAQALALTTASAADLACPWQGEDGQRGGIAAPRVDAVVVAEDDAAATAEVTFTSIGEVTQELTLIRDGDAWRVEWPDTYVVNVEFAVPAVAELRFDVDGEDSGCAIGARGAAITAPAFPGTYVAHVVDPTGVADYGRGVNLGVDGVDTAAWELGDPVGEEAVAALAADLRLAVEAGVARCDDAGTAVPCPAGPDPSLDAASFADSLALTGVSTEDNASWSFTADGPAGELTGTLERREDGLLVPTFVRD